jgi:ribulose-phosphate 3-epimerase
VLVMSVNPGFGGQKFLPFTLHKIARLAELREEMGLNFRIEVDGGVAHDTVGRVVEAGADMLVAGSAIFSPGKTEQNAREFLKTARAASPGQS